MGVGLTLTRRLVELHGGSIVVNSEGRGKGSEFVVQLPLTANRPSKNEPMDDPGQEPLRILIVEDNADSRQMLETILRLDGYQVATASDGLQGLEAIRSAPPDIALIDIGLPQLDGYQLAKRVRAQHPNAKLRLVALTGYGRDEDRKAVMEAGFDEHLVKPVHPGDLTRVLRKPR